MNPLTKLKNKKNAGNGYEYPDYFEDYVNPELQRMADMICAAMAGFGVSIQEATDAMMELFGAIEWEQVIDQKKVDRQRSKEDVQRKRRQSRGRNGHILPR